MEGLARIPQDRIAVLIGRKGVTRRALEEATNSKLHIDSTTGDVSVVWNEEFDPILRMKFPDVIRAIGRGMNPERALQLLKDDQHLILHDMREYVGKNANQQRRIRSRLIGRNGRIRELIEEHSGAEIVIYGSTVVIIGDEEALPLASQAIERLLQGAEHSSVLKHLETERRKKRMSARNLESIDSRQDDNRFDALVPGLEAARRKRERRYKDAQVDPDDAEAIEEMMELAEDESIGFEEE
ncbi:MAG: KH domain-containing protein [Candidatus Thalassarchaeaceae archaeon]|jgi:ribosomal RNA assembly protein|nr:KH domain-containing protein [Candidatus Thalassarchaeaceae archaeon]MDP6844113.1 KH domain-containing protein [Candidatus Thalassarchaeaceae archaeon]